MAPVFLQEILSIQYIIFAIVAACLVLGLIRLYTDPLGHVPGPLFARVTPVWLWYHVWKGTDSKAIAALHTKYGPMVRIAPNEVDISDGAAIHPIYVKNRGFPKSPIYRNFDLDGIPTIFSTVNPVERVVRAKAVAPMFAQNALVKGKPTIMKVVDAMVLELERRRAGANGRPVDVLNLFRSLALDSVSVYLFGESFNGLGEERLAASAFVDDFAAGGRFFYLPSWLYDQAYSWTAKFSKDRLELERSSVIVHKFATRMVDKSISEGKGEDQTYQGRLLRAGISREETISQVKDVIFAGTDSTGFVMSSLCFYLAKYPDKYRTVRDEVLENPGADPQSLPYLSAVVKETLRLAMANPIRLPRIVSSEGLQVAGLPTLPGGTSVGVGSYMLHHNPEVFPEPYQFSPERWSNPSPEMLRDSFYFGMGSRQCIGRNLASAEIFWSAEALIRSGVLDGSVPVRDNIETLAWFNVKIICGKVELVW